MLAGGWPARVSGYVQGVDRTLAVQAAYYLVTGAAPFISRRGFEAVTGREWWLVRDIVLLRLEPA